MSEDAGVSLEACPNVWDYLRDAGREGWELVSVVTHPQEVKEAALDVLYLKRPRGEAETLSRRRRKTLDAAPPAGR